MPMLYVNIPFSTLFSTLFSVYLITIFPLHNQYVEAKTSLRFSGHQIECYDCIGDDKNCNKSNTCMGVWCVQGPNAKIGLVDGSARGCSDTAPLERVVEGCEFVTVHGKMHSNCYCNNQNFCNESVSPLVAPVLIFIMPVFIFITR